METKNAIDDLDFSQIIVNPEDINIVISHINCSDGLAAAYSAWKFLGDKSEYHFVAAGSKNIPCDLKDKYVAICDVCFNYETTLQIIKEAKGVVILDHHLTAKNDIEKIDNKYKLFRMDHSGAYLAWRFFHREKPVPRFILHVEDRDIWTKKLPDNDEFVASFYSILPSDYEDDDEILEVFHEYDKYLDDAMVDKAIEEGKIANKFKMKEIAKQLSYAAVKLCSINNKAYLVAYYNSNSNKSEIGHALLNEYKLADFSVVYNQSDKGNETSYSLRSEDSRTDVAMIAKALGGGGHRNASGCRAAGVHSTLPCYHYEVGNINGIIDNRITRTIQFTEYSNKQNAAFLNFGTNMDVIAKYLYDRKLCDIAILWYQKALKDEKIQCDFIYVVCIYGKDISKHLSNTCILNIEPDERPPYNNCLTWVKTFADPLITYKLFNLF